MLLFLPNANSKHPLILMKNTNRDRQIIYQDNSLSSFITGVVIGAVAALLMGTKEGRILTSKLKKNLSSLAEEIKPFLDDLPPKTHNLVENLKSQKTDLTPLPPDLIPPAPPSNLVSRLHRNNPSPTFTQGGKPL